MTRRLTAILILATSATAGTAMYASPACKRAITTTVRRILPNRVSKRVSERWAEWGRMHPNWHPKPNAPKRAAHKVILAKRTEEVGSCFAVVDVAPPTLMLAPIVPTLEMVELPQPTMLGVTLSPPLVQQAIETADAEEYPAPAYSPGFVGWFGGLPSRPHHRHRHTGIPTPPVDLPTPPSPVPEPSTFVLVGSAVGVLQWVKRK